MGWPPGRGRSPGGCPGLVVRARVTRAQSPLLWGPPPSEPLLTGADLPLRLEIIQIPNSMLGREVPGQAAVVVQAAVELRLVFGPKLLILL